MGYRCEVGGVPLALDRLSGFLLDTLDQRAQPWWDALAKPDLLGFDDISYQVRWDNSEAKERARWLLSQLWEYRDRVPWEYCDILELPRSSTFAQASRRLWRDLLEESPEQ